MHVFERFLCTRVLCYATITDFFKHTRNRYRQNTISIRAENFIDFNYMTIWYILYNYIVKYISTVYAGSSVESRSEDRAQDSGKNKLLGSSDLTVLASPSFSAFVLLALHISSFHLCLAGSPRSSWANKRNRKVLRLQESPVRLFN